MRKPVLLVFVFLLMLFSCDKDDDPKGIPDCLKPTIDRILSNPPQSPKATIETFLYQGQKVYLVDAEHFADGQAHVVSLDCRAICDLGGIDGPMNDCPDWDKAQFIETLWTDPR